MPSGNATRAFLRSWRDNNEDRGEFPPVLKNWLRKFALEHVQEQKTY